MKNAKISRRSFLKAGAVASAVGMLSAAPVAAHAAEADASAAADEENGLPDVFKKPKYVFLFIGDGMGTAQIQSARFYKGTVNNNGAVTEADLSFTSYLRQHLLLPGLRFHRHLHRHRPQDRERCHQYVPVDPRCALRDHRRKAARPEGL